MHTKRSGRFTADPKHIFFALSLAALLAAGCTRQKPPGKISKSGGAERADVEAVPRVMGFGAGSESDELATTITLNPCKGETPGNVLGVSEDEETPRRVAGFVAKLRDPDPKTRACAVRQLSYLGPEASEALPHLVKLVRDEEDTGVGVNVTEALWKIGPGSGLNFEELTGSIKSGDVYVRLYAAFTLGYYKPHPAREKQTVRALDDAAKDEDVAVRWMAVRGLMRMGPTAKEAVPTLVAIVLDEKSTLRHHAAMALGSIGPEAEPAAPALLKVFYESQDFALYHSASRALGQIGPAVVPLLERDMKGGRALRALDVLRHLKPSGAALVIGALNAKDAKVRDRALEIVGDFGDSAKPAVPTLAKGLRNPDKEVRRKAASALSSLGQVAEAAAPELLAALGDEDDLVRCDAASAVGRLGAAGAAGVPELRRMLEVSGERESFGARRCAAKALMGMSAETRALVPAEIIKEVEEEDASYRSIFGRDEADVTKPKPRERKPAPVSPNGGPAF